MSAVFLASVLAITAPQDLPAQLSDVVVEGRRPDPRLTVSVTGAIPVEVIVRSDPAGIRCGAARFQYEPFAAPRLCWVRRPQGEMITLTVEGMDRFGPGWVAEWEGCEPRAAPTQCSILVPPGGASINVRIHRA